MKKLILSSGMLMFALNLSLAQCCNVVSSNGVSAVTSNGICMVTVSGLSGNCLKNKDTDKDGVLDKEDVCPDVPGVIENKGCPVVSTEEMEILTMAIHGVHFETESDSITAESFPLLDKIVAIMKLKPYYKLHIEGHTDSSGDTEFNLALSKKRAAAVRKYIEDKGVSSFRLDAEGYGETRPLTTNETPEGMMHNRRVDFIIKF